ncbi:hypothetical protein BKA56DRAFT_113865 [Ilyonectria sp. MPI-CAGE-AT-0026]|nr:hypothetical protein BKA56DRAFT_113865 [Ilyonectria sp. MPI-CAGE-AT-0026]
MLSSSVLSALQILILRLLHFCLASAIHTPSKRYHAYLTSGTLGNKWCPVIYSSTRLSLILLHPVPRRICPFLDVLQSAADDLLAGSPPGNNRASSHVGQGGTGAYHQAVTTDDSCNGHTKVSTLGRLWSWQSPMTELPINYFLVKRWQLKGTLDPS